MRVAADAAFPSDANSLLVSTANSKRAGLIDDIEAGAIGKSGGCRSICDRAFEWKISQPDSWLRAVRRADPRRGTHR